MAEHAVVNASPLIFLTRADLLDLLRLVSPEILVPAPVAEEIGRRGSGDPAARAIATVPWLRIVPSLTPSWTVLCGWWANKGSETLRATIRGR